MIPAMINRREFHALALAAVSAGAAGSGATVAQAAADPADVYLNRLTFGASRPSRERFAQQGLHRWLDDQLAETVQDNDLAARLAAAKLTIEYAAGKDVNGKTWRSRKEDAPYRYLAADAASLLPLVDYQKMAMSYEERIRPAREVQAASLIRAVHARHQLREVMTQFWHDHFNVNSMRDEHTGAYFGVYDRMLRANALGSFRLMLGEVTRSPAMLFYLNNEASRASPANENFARELFELHTLGAVNYLNGTTTEWSEVPRGPDGIAAGYIDQDVYEAARALTGWSFGDGRWLAEGENAPLTGEFFYNDRWHDPYQKRILAVEFKANGGPMADGEKLLDMLSGHPGTARFIAEKICRRLVSDNPPQELIARAAASFVQHAKAPDQIGQVVRTIVLDQAFAQSPPSKLKRPFEYLASVLRAANANVTSPSLDFLWVLSKAGWNQHECRPPTGHVDLSSHWANTGTLNGLVDMACYALEDWSRIGSADFAALHPQRPQTVAQACTDVFATFHGKSPTTAEAAEIARLITGETDKAWPDDPQYQLWLHKGLIAMAALSPNFLFR